MHTKQSRHSRTRSGAHRGRTFSRSQGPSHRGGGHFRNDRGRSGFGAGHGRGRGGNRGGRKMPSFDPTRFINTNPVDAVETVYTPKHNFTTMGLDARIVKVLTNAKLTEPTPIQDQVIPEILAGRDVIGIAETGTGKTAAFLLPVIQKTLKEYNNRQTLILAPTRELALQIEAELRKFTFGMGIFSTVCVGGTSMGPQIRGLRQRNHFIIGTPGRVLDLMQRGNFNPKYITTVVLDEADRMLDMGFIHDMRKILSAIPAAHETLLFSATMDATTKSFAESFTKNPATVSVKKRDVISTIEQDIVHYHDHDKFETLRNLLNDESFKRVIIFGAMKHSVEKLSIELTRSGIKATSIHGNKNHNARQRSLRDFKSGQVRVLVATDVAARGIHVDGVSHVINYDLPTTFEDYVHRIGRTGRGTHRGKALTFVRG